MSWLKIDDALPEHEKFADLSDAALALWLKCNCWANKTQNQVTCGFVPEREVVRFCGGSKAKARKLARELVESRGEPHYGHANGLWIVEEGGWRFHDWDKYRPASKRSPEEQGELSEKRSAAGKAGAKARWGRRQLYGTGDSKVAIGDDGKQDSNPDGSPDPVTRYPLPKPTAAAVDGPPRLPSSMEEALPIPIRERAQLMLDNGHASWLTPHRWPELVKVAAASNQARGLSSEPRLTSYPQDNTRQLVELYAAGYTQAQLETAVRSEWWARRRNGFSSLTTTVVDKALSAEQPQRDPDAERRRREREQLEADRAARKAARRAGVS